MGCGSSSNVTVIHVQEKDNDTEPLLNESQQSFDQNDRHQTNRQDGNFGNKNDSLQNDKANKKKQETERLENGVNQPIQPSKSPVLWSKSQPRVPYPGPKYAQIPNKPKTKHKDGLKDDTDVGKNGSLQNDKTDKKKQKTERLQNGVNQPIQPSKSEPRVPQIPNKQDGKEENDHEGDIEVDTVLAEHKEWTLLYTFWDEKRRLMADLDRIKTIDQHALNAPSNLRLKSKPLVDYLIKGARTELEKFRVIFRWITNNIKYDVGFLDGRGKGGTEPEDVLRNGFSVCAGYSKLYEYLCRMANLRCCEVTGLAKGATYLPAMELPYKLSGLQIAHAWNKISIDGVWYLCDATWAAGSVGPDAKNGRPQFKRKFHESWFITEPRAFGASHLPFTQPVTIDNVDIESQHSPAPYITCQEWNEEPQKYPEFFSSSMECISHTLSGKIESHNNEVKIKVKVRYPMDIFTTLVAVSNGTEKELPRNKYTVHFFQDNLVVVKVRLPKRGKYTLTICGTPYGVSEEIKASLNVPLLTYQIIETGEESLASFPQVSGGLGSSWKFKLHGFSTSTKTPFLEAKNGKVDIEVQCRNGIKPMSSSFIQHGDVNGGEKLDNFIYGERCTDNRVVYHIRCPKVGTYVFKIYVKYGDNDRDPSKYEQGSSFQISCSGAPTKEKFPNENSSLWGPNNTMSKFGISTSNKSSTIVTENNGEGVLYLSLPSGVKISQKLYDVDGKNAGLNCLCAETKADGTDGSKQVNLRIRCPKAALYRLMVFGNNESENKNEFLGMWMVYCSTPCSGQMFPECQQLWGPNPHFKSLGLKVQSPPVSTINTKKGNATLVLRCNVDDYNTNKFIHSLLINGKSANQERRCIMAEINHEGNAVILRYHFRLTKKGMYDFRLFGNPRNIGNNTFAGQWMIVCDEPCSERDLFPEYHRPWGPAENFDKLMLQLREPKSSTLCTNDGTCNLIIESTKAFDTLQTLKDSRGNSIKSAFTLAKEKENGKHVLFIEFSLPKPGSYAFDLFAMLGGGGGNFDFVGKWFVVYIK